MRRDQFSVDEVLAILRPSPDRLAELSTGVDPDLLLAEPSPGQWSARDVLAHILACCDTWGSAVLRLLREDTPVLRGTDPMVFLATADYEQRSYASLLERFTLLRSELLSALDSASSADWQRPGTLVGAGRPFPVTPLYYADKIARHERPHLKQITRGLASLHH